MTSEIMALTPFLSSIMCFFLSVIMQFQDVDLLLASRVVQYLTSKSPPPPLPPLRMPIEADLTPKTQIANQVRGQLLLQMKTSGYKLTWEVLTTPW